MWTAPVKSVRLRGEASSLQLWPNPVTDKLVLAYTADREGPATIRLLQGNGQPARTMAVRFAAGANQVTLNGLQGLAAGMYVVEVLNGRGERIGGQKIVKQ